MFDSKKYYREYARQWRKTHPLTEQQKAKASEYAKAYIEQKRQDPEWVAAERKRRRERERKRRKDPSVKAARTKSHTKWVAKNRNHVNANQRRWAATPAYRRKARARHLGKKYGITIEAYEQKIAANNGKCPICRDDISVKPCVDHNHATGQVRDVLCNSCNQWIGFVETRRNLVAPMLAYLDKWNAIEGVIKQVS